MLDKSVARCGTCSCIEVTRAYMAINESESNSIFDTWIAESGATDHMTVQLHWFTNCQPLPITVQWPVEKPAVQVTLKKLNIKILPAD